MNIKTDSEVIKKRTTMKHFNQFVNRRSKYDEIFEKVDKYGMNIEHSSTKSNKILNHFKYNVFPKILKIKLV